MALTPDIIARVNLADEKSGGRTNTIPAETFGCPFVFEGEAFDCRLLLDQAGIALAAGISATVPIKFLYPELIKPRLRPGSHFKLWEFRDFAEGEVLEVVG